MLQLTLKNYDCQQKKKRRQPREHASLPQMKNWNSSSDCLFKRLADEKIFEKWKHKKLFHESFFKIYRSTSEWDEEKLIIELSIFTEFCFFSKEGERLMPSRCYARIISMRCCKIRFLRIFNFNGECYSTSGLEDCKGQFRGYLMGLSVRLRIKKWSVNQSSRVDLLSQLDSF